ncbi:MAG: cupin domain-containing protein [Rhodospirillales bacterium]|nr:cupin domain-containing protein [Rhodospirillales bacterium]
MVDEYTASFADADTMEAFYEKVAHMNVVCAWTHSDTRGSPDPSSNFKAAHWKYTECRAALTQAAKLISAEDAGRRVLNFRNPAPDHRLGATNTLLHAYQLILPGETAPAHRHTAHALRVILDAKDIYSVVEGEKTLMETGDVVLTPGGMWHSHEHNGDEVACWIDGLDMPLVMALQLQTWEPHPDRYEKVEKVAIQSPFRFAANDIAKRLDGANEDPDGYYGKRVRLEADTMPTLGVYVMRLDGGTTTRPYRTNANVSFCVMGGSGTSIIGDEKIDWRHGDIFVAPTWNRIEHRPAEDSQILSMTDEPLLRFAKYYRFEEAD